MQEIHHLLQRLFGFILTCHILTCNACLLFHIHLGIALSDSHHAAALGHPAGHPDKQPYNTQHRQKCKQ